MGFVQLVRGNIEMPADAARWADLLLDSAPRFDDSARAVLALVEREFLDAAMDNDLVAPLVGGCIVTFGVILIRSHIRSHRKQLADPKLEEADRRFADRQFRRRMQTSALLVGIGALIPVGDQLLPLQRAPFGFAVFWSCVLLATVWVVFQALGDMAATKVHSRASLARVRRKQRELREELSRLRRQNNGHGTGSNG